MYKKYLFDVPEREENVKKLNVKNDYYRVLLIATYALQ